MEKGQMVVIVFLVGVAFTSIVSTSTEMNDTSSLLDKISPPRGKPNQQCCDSYCCSYCEYSTTWGPDPSTELSSTTQNYTETTTSRPPPISKPEFTKTIYQSALPSWPLAGTTVRLGIHANTSDAAPLRYQLVTTYEFLTLSASQDIIFTSNVADGAFVGPNNVMIIEVSALVIGDETRSSNAAVVLVFPRSTREEEAASDGHS